MAASSPIPDVSRHAFILPTKKISNPGDIPVWEKSQAYGDVLGFILKLNDAVKNKRITDIGSESESVSKVMNVIDTMEKWIDSIPPLDQAARFGNAAFRTWYEKLQKEGPGLVQDMLPHELRHAVDEVSCYLIEGVGNQTRIDYGSGHELSFVAFLCCLAKLGFFEEDDHAAVVLKIFDKYLKCVRKLQTTYRMEPAGSHGVWSIDDYQFLPFLWGSSQFLGNGHFAPESFVDEKVVELHHQDYLFFAAIKYINTVKTGLFAEHSNILWSMSSVPTWTKINSGLIKMYKAEVLPKYPVIQHFLFGSLLTLAPASK